MPTDPKPTPDPTTEAGRRWLAQLARDVRRKTIKCRSCGAKWCGLRDAACYPICVQCGARI